MQVMGGGKTGKKYAMFISERWIYGGFMDGFYFYFLHFSTSSKYSFNTLIF